MDPCTGLGEICSLDVPVYPRLVHLFFENLRIGIISIESTVKDVLIVLDARIANILEMPRNGLGFLNLENKFDELKVILERDDVMNLKNLQANQLW